MNKGTRYLLCYKMPFDGGNIEGHAFATFDKLSQLALEATAKNFLEDAEKDNGRKCNTLIWVSIIQLEA